MIYTHVLPNGPLAVASPADTPEPGTDIGLMLRQMAVMMKKLAPMAAALPDAPPPVAAVSDAQMAELQRGAGSSPHHSGGSILLPQAADAAPETGRACAGHQPYVSRQPVSDHRLPSALSHGGKSRSALIEADTVSSPFTPEHIPVQGVA